MAALSESLPHVASPVNEDLIGARLVAAGKIGVNDVEKALAFQREIGGQGVRSASNRLGAVLVRMGALSEERRRQCCRYGAWLEP